MGEIEWKIRAIKGCRKGFHGPWEITHYADGTMLHICSICGHREVDGKEIGHVFTMENHETAEDEHFIEALATGQANNLIAMEMARQNQKWGIQTHSDYKWLAILSEEIGEAAEAILQEDQQPANQTKYCDADKEIVHVAAVTIQWVIARQRKKILSGRIPETDGRNTEQHATRSRPIR